MYSRSIDPAAANGNAAGSNRLDTSFVCEGGRLVIVTRGREDDEVPDEVPWPVSRKDLGSWKRTARTEDFIVMSL